MAITLYCKQIKTHSFLEEGPSLREKQSQCIKCGDFIPVVRTRRRKSRVPTGRPGSTRRSEPYPRMIMDRDNRHLSSSSGISNHYIHLDTSQKPVYARYGSDCEVPTTTVLEWGYRQVQPIPCLVRRSGPHMVADLRGLFALRAPARSASHTTIHEPTISSLRRTAYIEHGRTWEQ
jgi:hypothetical protein